jgi:hypothetical protein
MFNIGKMAFTGAEFSDLRLGGCDWEKRPLQFFYWSKP